MPAFSVRFLLRLAPCAVLAARCSPSRRPAPPPWASPRRPRPRECSRPRPRPRGARPCGRLLPPRARPCRRARPVIARPSGVWVEGTARGPPAPPPQPSPLAPPPARRPPPRLPERAGSTWSPWRSRQSGTSCAIRWRGTRRTWSGSPAGRRRAGTAQRLPEGRPGFPARRSRRWRLRRSARRSAGSWIATRERLSVLQRRGSRRSGAPLQLRRTRQQPRPPPEASPRRCPCPSSRSSST